MSAATDRILPAVAAALAHDLGASMQAIASAAGIGRTTLHRHFPTRQDLTRAVADHALAECDRIFEEVGIDGSGAVPAREALDRLASQVLPLALTYTLLWAEPPITSKVQVEAEADLRDARFEQFAIRGQNEGCFRSDVPARWIVYSIGSQAVAVGWAVRFGYAGAREAERLFRSTVIDGLGPATAHTPSSATTPSPPPPSVS